MRKIYFLLFFIILYSQSAYSQTFTNVGPQMGLSHMYGGGFNGGGLSFVDFNQDGNDDLFLSSSFGESVIVEKNNLTSFENITSSFNFNHIFESKTTLCADYDNDGDMDIVIIHFIGPIKLYRNDNGSFTNVSNAAGFTNDSLKSTAAIWFDYNKDGYLDLYVGVYSGFGNNDPLDNLLYKNLGNGTFQNVSTNANAGNAGNKVLAMASIDYNNDGWEDVYIASDRRYGNSMLKNNGNGTFTEVSQQTGTYFQMDGMGLSIGDYDNNGYFDIYVSNGEEGNVFLKNNGNGTFTEVAAQLNMSVNRICWGSNFIDYNNDGWLDLFVSVSGGPTNRYSVFYRNNGNGTFTKMTGIGLESGEYSSYGCAMGDYDNNGYNDIAEMNVGDSVSLWKNSGGSNKWIKIKLQGTYSNRNGIGSVIEIWRGGTKFKRPVLCGQSYCSQNTLLQTIGVGSTTVIDSVIVYWPSGIRQPVLNVNSNQQITIIETGVIGISGNNNQVPENYKLFQNYPNPFNPSTIIEYSVPKGGNVKIALYNILGSEIAVLENNYRSAGFYMYRLDERISSGLSSGIYYYTIFTDEFSDTKKMILIK